MDEIDELDEVRHQHHLRHRSEGDKRLAVLVWCVVLIIILIRVGQRTVFWCKSRRNKQRYTTPRLKGSNTSSLFARAVVFLRACSLLSFPRPLRSSPIQFPLLSLGHISLIPIYGLAIGLLIFSVDAPTYTPHFLDDVAFRAAWMTLTQVPLVYLLATKRGPLNFLTGLSYERINWIHRWAGRILFLSATTHMSIMMMSIEVNDILRSPDKVMIIVRYGAVSYGLLAWIALSSILPLRRWSYRLFYVNHVASSAVVLYTIFRHVPKYARPPVYLACAIVLFDRITSFLVFLRNNIQFRDPRKSLRHSKQKSSVVSIGHAIEMALPVVALPPPSYGIYDSDYPSESTTIIRVNNLPFSWKPGQHVRLYIPRLGFLEVHPFTPATASKLGSSTLFNVGVSDIERTRSPTEVDNDMTFLIRAHHGLTRRLFQFHSQWLSSPCPNASKSVLSLTGYVDGPFGSTPNWNEYESLTLVATSTGVSFTLSIMDYLAQFASSVHGSKHLQVRNIRFVWIVRHLEPQFDAGVVDMLNRHSSQLRDAGVEISVHFYITCTQSGGFEAGSLASLRHHAGWRTQENLRTGESAEEAGLFDDAGSEDGASTLVDDDEALALPEISLTQQRTPRWRTLFDQLLPTKQQYQQVSASADVDADSYLEKESCSCRLIRSQQDRLPLGKHIERVYGARPDIASILGSAVPNDTSRSMVGICANAALMNQAKNTVAYMNFEYAFGRRRSNVEIFTEGFT